VNAETTSLEVSANAVRSASDEEDHQKTSETAVGARLSATELLTHDVVPEHRVLFRVSIVGTPG